MTTTLTMTTLRTPSSSPHVTTRQDPTTSSHLRCSRRHRPSSRHNHPPPTKRSNNHSPSRCHNQHPRSHLNRRNRRQHLQVPQSISGSSPLHRSPSGTTFPCSGFPLTLLCHRNTDATVPTPSTFPSSPRLKRRYHQAWSVTSASHHHQQDLGSSSDNEEPKLIHGCKPRSPTPVDNLLHVTTNWPSRSLTP